MIFKYNRILTNNFPSFHNTNIPEEIGNLTNLEYLLVKLLKIISICYILILY